MTNALDLIDMFLGIIHNTPSVLNFAGFVTLWSHPRFFVLCYEKFRPFFSYNKPSFTSTAWGLAVDLYLRNLVHFGASSYVQDEWHGIFRRLFDDGVDVHCLSSFSRERPETIALRFITTYKEDSLWTDEVVWYWAMLLQRCGVNVRLMLERERQLWQLHDPAASDSWYIDSSSYWRLFFKHRGGYDLPAWERLVSHDSSAHELLYEFRLWDWKGLERDYSKTVEEIHQFVNCTFCSDARKSNKRCLGKKRRRMGAKKTIGKQETMPGSWVDL